MNLELLVNTIFQVDIKANRFYRILAELTVNRRIAAKSHFSSDKQNIEKNS